MRTTATGLIACIAALMAPASAFAQTCPEPLADARRLVLVPAQDMASVQGTAQLFVRASAGEPWRPSGRAFPARLGRTGMGWSQAFRAVARAGEPVKAEGDKRAPAGIYRIGRSFGFAASTRRGYLRLTRDTVCVDDPFSPAYNTITARAAVGARVSVERMGRVREYRRGLFVDYPTDAAARAGSCIFIHVWDGKRPGTSGCVAFEEAKVSAVQDFAENGAVLAILPAAALDRFRGCLPDAASAQ
jgi:D-alanyl-D-alanine dipeptidase